MKIYKLQLTVNGKPTVVKMSYSKKESIAKEYGDIKSWANKHFYGKVRIIDHYIYDDVSSNLTVI